jgi:HD-GYP domain-containing protein (c-di-GMP phosphodiesterase class II)
VPPVVSNVEPLPNLNVIGAALRLRKIADADEQLAELLLEAARTEREIAELLRRVDFERTRERVTQHVERLAHFADVIGERVELLSGLSGELLTWLHQRPAAP